MIFFLSKFKGQTQIVTQFGKAIFMDRNSEKTHDFASVKEYSPWLGSAHFYEILKFLKNILK